MNRRVGGSLVWVGGCGPCGLTMQRYLSLGGSCTSEFYEKTMGFKGTPLVPQNKWWVRLALVSGIRRSHDSRAID